MGEKIIQNGKKRFKDFEISPGRVDIIKTGGKEIEYIKTIGVLVQAVRELTGRIEALGAK